MAGAGIGTCVLCGKENQALVSDLCPDCTMKAFFDGLESSPLALDQRVKVLHGGVWRGKLAVVVEPFTGNWNDQVTVAELDHGVMGRVTAYKRSDVSYL